MQEQINLEDLRGLAFHGFNDPNPDNTLIVFQYENAYRFYHVRIERKSILRDRQIKPPRFEIISGEELYLLPDEVEREIQERVSSDSTLGAMLVEETIPLQKTLTEKLELVVTSYVLCQGYLEH